MLVLQSEDFFERPVGTLKVVLKFLDLPDWEPKVWELRYKRNQGKYKQKIDPAIGQRLESHFEPHNRRLYEYLGVDFGWLRSSNDRTYIRQYRREEVLEILEKAGLELMTFDKVVRDPQHPRLLVVATKSY